jgi:hypothetical protein
MAGDIIGTTVLTGLSITSSPGSAQTAPGVVPVLSVAGGSRVDLASNTSLVVASGATVTFSPGMMWSVGTIAAASSLASLAGTGMQVGLFFAASGLSLVCRSGNSLYYFNSAASGAAP